MRRHGVEEDVGGDLLSKEVPGRAWLRGLGGGHVGGEAAAVAAGAFGGGVCVFAEALVGGLQSGEARFRV